jgi:nucleoid DNA-binding protein
MGKIAIQDVASKLIVQNGLSKKEATRFANKMFDLIREALEEDKTVKVKGLGTFKIIDVESRESVNVNTGERVLIEGHNKITFTPDLLMKELVNKPFSQFETIVLNDGVDFKDPSQEELDQETIEAEESEGESDNMPLVDFASEEKPASADVIADEDIPEWVIEPCIIPAPEKPVEPEKLVEPEIPVEPEPMMQLEQSAEPEPKVEEEIAEEDTAEEEETDLDELSEEEQPADRKWLLWLLTCLLALVAGYLLGSYVPLQSLTGPGPVIDETVVEVPAPKSSEAPAGAEPQKQPEKQSKLEKQSKSEEKSKPEEKSTLEEQTKPEAQAPAEVVLDKYETKDSRVKNGAYRIVGTDFVEKVREGDNLQRIAKRTLGEGMECYIEVYNDLHATSELKTGQEIKIPKVEWKKKKKAQN